MEDDPLLVPGRQPGQRDPAGSRRFMAHRMGAHTVQINSSHVAMISHPRAVTNLILDAAEATD